MTKPPPPTRPDPAAMLRGGQRLLLSGERIRLQLGTYRLPNNNFGAFLAIGIGENPPTNHNMEFRALLALQADLDALIEQIAPSMGLSEPPPTTPTTPAASRPN